MCSRPRSGPRALALGLLWALLAAPGCTTWHASRLYQHGTASLDAGQPGQAISDLEAAADLVPFASEVQNHLGLAYVAAGRDAEGLHAFQRAVALDCRNDAAQANLAAARAHARALASAP